MSTTVTPAEVLTITDKIQDAYLLNDLNVMQYDLAQLPGLTYGNGTPTAGTADYVFISKFGSTANNYNTVPIYASFAKSTFQPYFAALASWSSSVSLGATLDAYLTGQNGSAGSAATYTATALVTPTTAWLYYFSQNSLNAMTPQNVYAPSGLQMGSGVVGASAAITFTQGIPISPVNNGVQTVTVSNATGGTFILTYGGTATAAIAYNAAPATVQTALTAISTIGANNAIVQGSAGNYTITLRGTLTNTTAPLFTATSSLTGTGATVTVAQAVGTQIVTLTSATGGTFTLTWGNQTTSNIAYNATAATVQSALLALTNVPSSGVAVSGSAGGPYTITYSGYIANWPILSPITANGANLTGSGATIATQVSAIGGPQGYAPAKSLRANITTAINGTLTLTITGNGWSSTGAIVTGRTWTATLDNLTAGQTATFTPTISGDRLGVITAASGSGTASAGGFTITTLAERTPA